MKVKLADALLRRKELQGKLDQLAQIRDKSLFEIRGQRVKVADGLDEVTAQVPLLTASQVTQEHDWHARQLRLIDAKIQQANWTTDVDVEDSVMEDYKQPGPWPPRGPGVDTGETVKAVHTVIPRQ
jgi:hypothetical protein